MPMNSAVSIVPPGGPCIELIGIAVWDGRRLGEIIARLGCFLAADDPQPRQPSWLSRSRREAKYAFRAEKFTDISVIRRFLLIARFVSKVRSSRVWHCLDRLRPDVGLKWE